LGVGFIEEIAAPEVAKHAALDDALQVLPVVVRNQGGLMEADLTVGGLRERAIEHHDVIVEMGVER
jgi:hypothetical protein